MLFIEKIEQYNLDISILKNTEHLEGCLFSYYDNNDELEKDLMFLQQQQMISVENY